MTKYPRPGKPSAHHVVAIIFPLLRKAEQLKVALTDPITELKLGFAFEVTTKSVLSITQFTFAHQSYSKIASMLHAIWGIYYC
jgi:hypothetical protein